MSKWIILVCLESVSEYSDQQRTRYVMDEGTLATKTAGFVKVHSVWGAYWSWHCWHRWNKESGDPNWRKVLWYSLVLESCSARDAGGVLVFGSFFWGEENKPLWCSWCTVYKQSSHCQASKPLIFRGCTSEIHVNIFIWNMTSVNRRQRTVST